MAKITKQPVVDRRPQFASRPLDVDDPDVSVEIMRPLKTQQERPVYVSKDPPPVEFAEVSDPKSFESNAVNRIGDVVGEVRKDFPTAEQYGRSITAELKKEPQNDTLVGVWVGKTLRERLDAYRGGKTRPQAIREILEEHLP